MSQIILKQWDGQMVTSKDDAIMNDAMAGISGIITGCILTSVGADMIRIEAGRGILKGRQFEIEEHTISVTLSTSGKKSGRVYIHMDLSNLESPIEIRHITTDPLPDLVQEEDCNLKNGIYEMELAVYEVDAQKVASLSNTAPDAANSYMKNMLSNLEEIGVVTEKGFIPDALAIQELNGKFAGCWISFTDAEGNPTDVPYIHWVGGYTPEGQYVPEALVFKEAIELLQNNKVDKEDVPFKLGIDENGNCGFIKPGEDTVTPFGSGGGGGGGTTIPTFLNDVITKGIVKTYNSTNAITCEEGHKYLIFAAYLTEPAMAETHNVYVSGADIISDIIVNKTGVDNIHIADMVSYIISANQTDVVTGLEYNGQYSSNYQYIMSIDITGYESIIDISNMSVVEAGNVVTLTEGKYYMIFIGAIGNGYTDLTVSPQHITYYNSLLLTGSAAYSHCVKGKAIFIKSLGGITTFTFDSTAEKNCLYIMEIQ